MLLFRPVGLKELELIYDSKMRAFPPRLPEQPIFYPVLNIDYAREIAFDWNILTPPYAGFVTRFVVDDVYGSHFEQHIVGAKRHAELWVPAEELPQFNRHIIDPIQLIDARFGTAYEGFIPENAGLNGRNAKDQFLYLIDLINCNPPDARREIAANHKTVFLNFSYWQMEECEGQGMANEEKQEGLKNIQRVWSGLFPEIPLGFEP
jgi:hypothetical protein